MVVVCVLVWYQWYSTYSISFHQSAGFLMGSSTSEFREVRHNNKILFRQRTSFSHSYRSSVNLAVRSSFIQIGTGRTVHYVGTLLACLTPFQIEPYVSVSTYSTKNKNERKQCQVELETEESKIALPDVGQTFVHFIFIEWEIH